MHQKDFVESQRRVVEDEYKVTGPELVYRCDQVPIYIIEKDLIPTNGNYCYKLRTITTLLIYSITHT